MQIVPRRYPWLACERAVVAINPCPQALSFGFQDLNCFSSKQRGGRVVGVMALVGVELDECTLRMAESVELALYDFGSFMGDQDARVFSQVVERAVEGGWPYELGKFG